MADAADRLARSRLAIVDYVYRKEGRRDRTGAPNGVGDDEGDQWEAAQAAAASGGGGWFTRIKRAAKSYWYHHPARIGVQVATPMLASYARKHPATYVGVAAVAGALVMVARPWRLVSVTGVLVALAKSPQLASVVMSAMSGGSDDEFFT